MSDDSIVDEVEEAPRLNRLKTHLANVEARLLWLYGNERASENQVAALEKMRELLEDAVAKMERAIADGQRR